jgi:hypothetical protein
MSGVPDQATPNPEMLEKLAEWNAALNDLLACAPIVAKEKRLRAEVFALAFPSPVEGTNSTPLPQNWVLKGTYKLDRKLDVAVLPSVLQQLREQNVVADVLIQNKPELVVKQYKALSPENRAIFDQCLTTKPALPTLELVPPKEAPPA